MPHYSVVIVERDSNDPVHSLTDFEGMSVEFVLDGPARVPNIPVDGLAGAQLAEITELATDLVIYRNMQKIFRGRIHYTQDAIGPNRHTVTLSAIDYRGLLERRILWTDRNYNNIDQHNIAWDLIDYTQGLTNGGLGITRANTTATGVSRVRNYEAGQNIGTLLDQLSNVINGFEFEIDANKVFNLYYPQRGTVKDFVLELGGSVREVFRTVSPQDFGNAIRVSGESPDPGTVAVPVATRFAANLATATEGRWDVQIGSPDTTEQATVDQKADFELQNRAIVRPSYSMLLDSGSEPTMVKGNLWRGPDSLWLGDTAKLVVRTGRLNVVTEARVTEVALTLHESDEEDVRMTAGAPSLLQASIKQGKAVRTRLDTLERR